MFWLIIRPKVKDMFATFQKNLSPTKLVSWNTKKGRKYQKVWWLFWETTYCGEEIERVSVRKELCAIITVELTHLSPHKCMASLACMRGCDLYNTFDYSLPSEPHKSPQTTAVQVYQNAKHLEAECIIVNLITRYSFKFIK